MTTNDHRTMDPTERSSLLEPRYYETANHWTDLPYTPANVHSIANSSTPGVYAGDFWTLLQCLWTWRGGCMYVCFNYNYYFESANNFCCPVGDTAVKWSSF